MMTAHRFHASCVWLPRQQAGIIITGPAQSGKSSLALQLLMADAQLVSDDQTLVQQAPRGPVASAPEGLRGLLEIHGYGIVRLPQRRLATEAMLALYVAIMPLEQEIERLPEKPEQPVLTATLPRLALRPHDPAALAKIMAVLDYRLADYSDG